MVSEKEIIKHRQWSDQAEQGLSKALDGYAEFYKNEVNAGRCQLYKIGEHSWCILRIEVDNTTHEKILVGCCYQGVNYIEFGHYLINQAKQSGIDKIRIHSKSQGIGRWLENIFKFKIEETVYSLKV